MQGSQYLRYSNPAPTVKLTAFDAVTGNTVSSLLFSNVTVRIRRDNGPKTTLSLVTATLGTWVANGFISAGDGEYDLYLPTTANASGASSLSVTASAPGVLFNGIIVQLGVDDLSTAGLTAGEIATAVAAPSAATIATAVDAALADNFAAMPSAASIVTALRAETTGSAWGVSAQPTGGSTLTYTERRAGTIIGTRTAYFDSNGKPVGLTAVV